MKLFKSKESELERLIGNETSFLNTKIDAYEVNKEALSILKKNMDSLIKSLLVDPCVANTVVDYSKTFEILANLTSDVKMLKEEYSRIVKSKQRDVIEEIQIERNKRLDIFLESLKKKKPKETNSHILIKNNTNLNSNQTTAKTAVVNI